MTLDALRAVLRDPDLEVRAAYVGKLMRQAKPDDVFEFVRLDDVVALWPRLERSLGRERAMWQYLLGRWQEARGGDIATQERAGCDCTLDPAESGTLVSFGATGREVGRSGGMQAPHDAFFRRVFARPKRLAGLLRAVLPPEVAAGLVLDALEMASPIRVDEALKGQVSDLVCRVPVHGAGETLVVDFLPEHQSSRLPEMALRSAVYATQHMLEAARERRSRGVGVPAAVCVLFYTGPGRWRGPVRLHALLPALAKLPGLAPFVPDVRLLVLEVDRLSEAELAALPLDPYGQVALAAFRRVRSERPLEGLVRDLERLQGGPMAPEPGDVTSLLWYYAGVARGAMREDILSLPDRLVSPEDKMTAAEEWMKLGEARGEARGRSEGRSEGRTEEARRILRNLLQLKFGAVPQSLSSRIDAATHDALEQAVGRILTATSPDSVL